MGKFDITHFRFLESQHFRVLTAIEMGMKNHEAVPLPLVSSIAQIHRGATSRTLNDLTRSRLVVYECGKKYDGFRLSNLGYDYLALRALCSRSVVGSVGNQIGVGKESDIYVGGDPELNDVVLKLHRLGRTSFRKIKEKRDYHRRRHFCSWLYLSRIAALKEFAFLKALHDHGFPVPRPIDVCRHAVVMGLIEGPTLCHVDKLSDPGALYARLMSLIVRLARYGLIHGDFNEFNIMLGEDESPVIIDLPQMVSIDHSNAEFYFNRDVQCIRTFFKRKFDYECETHPTLADVSRKHNLDLELEASGFTKQMRQDLNTAYDIGNFTAHLEGEQSEEEDSKTKGEEDKEKGLEENELDDEFGQFEGIDDAEGVQMTERYDDEEEKDLEPEMDEPKREKQRDRLISTTSTVASISTSEIRKRLMMEKSRAKKEKLRVKGKQSAVRRGRQSNRDVIKESIGWDEY